MSEASSISIVASDRLDEKALVVELSDGSSVIITIQEILAAYPIRRAAAQDDESA